MLPWQQLIQSALLGTERHPLDAKTTTALKGLGIALSGEPPEMLARAMAAMGQLRKAKIPTHPYPGPLPPEAPPDEWPEISTLAAQHLLALLEGKHAPALQEFVDLLREKRRRIPATLLPRILESKTLKSTWPLLQPFIGNTGRWLLQQNPDWQQWALFPFAEGEEELETLWATANRSQRLQLLHQLRSENPHKAKELVEQAWQNAEWTDRLAFLEAFEQGLGPHDEAFLDACLDDQRAEVRHKAAELLVLLPSSALSQRMCRRAVNGLRYDGRLTLSIPDEPDADAVRDGIRLIAPEWWGGRKAAWLGQVVSRVPPTLWQQHFGLAMDDVLMLFLNSDWAETLVKAIAEATLRFKTSLWAEALLLAWLRRTQMAAWPHDIEKLARLARPDFLLRFAKMLQDENPDFLSAFGQHLAVFRVVQGYWPHQLVELLLENLRQSLQQNPSSLSDKNRPNELLHLMAYRLPPDMIDVALKELDELKLRHSSFLLTALHLQDVLRFRQKMIFEGMANH